METTLNLVLLQHPFASYCWKALIAFYETGVPFEARLVDGEEGRRQLAELWPPASIPVLRDEEADLTLPESTTIVEYVDALAPGGPALVPADPTQALQARLWDRFADGHLSTPMQKIVADELRPEGGRDPVGVAQAREQLDVAYGVLDDRLAGRPWVAGETFTLADCATFPPLFYLRAINRWDVAGHLNITRYYRDLATRPSCVRVVEEARPLRHFFPLPWPADQDDL